jgi:hypothetical protein
VLSLIRNQGTPAIMPNHSTPPTTGNRPIGKVVLDDPEGLAQQISEMLRSTAMRIEGTTRQGDQLSTSQGGWPNAKVTTKVGLPDLAGRPGRTATTISRGTFSRPILHISTQAVEGMRLTRMEPTYYLLTVARILDGGDGSPDARELRRIAVASALCDHHPAHERDLVVLHTATAFEPVYLYDEGPRYTTRLESRILRAGDGLSPMMERLPRITRAAIYRNPKGVASVAITPFADKAFDAITHEDLDLVGWREDEFARTEPA